MFVADLGSAGENVKRVRFFTFLRKHSTGVAKTQLHIVHVERGLSWTDAMAKYSELSGPKEGFYLSHQVTLRLIGGDCIALVPSSRTYQFCVEITDKKRQINGYSSGRIR